MGSGEERLREADEAWFGVASGCCGAAGFWFAVCVGFFDVPAVASRRAVSAVVVRGDATADLLKIDVGRGVAVCPGMRESQWY